MTDYLDDDFDGLDDWGRPAKRGITDEVLQAATDFLLGIDGRRPERPESRDDPAIPAPPGRFKKGQSGNPNGRPRRRHVVEQKTTRDWVENNALAEALTNMLAQEVTVRQGSGSIEMSVERAMTHKLLNDAMRGNVQAIRYVFTLRDRHTRQKARRDAEHYAQWADRRERYAAQHARATKCDNGILWSCPHPEDIELGPDRQVRIVGPMTKHELQRTRRIYQQGEYWFLLATYERWVQQRQLRRRPNCPIASAGLVSDQMFRHLQQQLPPRLRMTDEQQEARRTHYHSLAGRALHDQLRTEADSLNFPVPPRALRLPFTLAVPLSELLFPDVPLAVGAPYQFSLGPDEDPTEIFRQAWATLVHIERDERDADLRKSSGDGETGS